MEVDETYFLFFEKGKKKFKKWLERFKGVASKYLNHYLAWFQFLGTIEFEATKSNLKDMLIFACLFPVEETYDSLRKSKFVIP